MIQGTNHNRLDLEALRRAFAAEGPPASAAGEDCPDSERIWAAVRGELPDAERDTLLDHVAVCSACAEDWRLAAELARERRAGEAPVVPLHRPWTRQVRFLVPATVAACLLVVVGVVEERREERQLVAMRGDEQGAIRPLVAGALPRERFLLRWEGPEGALYDVRVTTDDLLREVAIARRLERRELLVPAAKLAGITPGSKLYWHVTAVRPDGEEVSSETFSIELR
ncbi:MAG TPA: zf-HC2 domain-containing protein [Thermoanaerobaculia bacterium]|nr:zf-HC2 domain-containing protein [Thermoanaerobaculia bacterium]